MLSQQQAERIRISAGYKGYVQVMNKSDLQVLSSGNRR